MPDLISVLIGLSGFVTAILTWINSRKKTAAEVQNLIGETYSELITNMRDQLKIQGDQITILMQKETEHLKMINHYQTNERELKTRVKELENEIKKLKKYNESN